MAKDGQLVDRRTVLRKAATSGVLVAGVGTASADTGPRHAKVAEAKRRFEDLEAVEGAFATYGEPLRAALLERGYLSADATPSVESVVSRREFTTEEDGGVAAVGTGRHDGTDVIDVRIRQQTDDHEIEYHLNPDADHAYALVHPDGGGTSVAVLPDGTEDVVATDTCCPATCSGCADVRCTGHRCDCVNGTIYYDKEQLCCYDVGGACDCSWDVYDCACSEYIGGCPI